MEAKERITALLVAQVAGPLAARTMDFDAASKGWGDGVGERWRAA
ncbi:hypothetical protein ACU4GD_39665 [Cupriavidus basilensis]